MRLNRRKLIKVLTFICGVSGVVILVSSFWPIVEYRLDETKRYKSLLSPLSIGTDYTKASSWFPEATNNVTFVDSKVSFYTISIPKLKIENAVVAIGGEDLTKNLVQYPGTALPGKRGNAVIFGHSILPIFFNPKNYTSIFSTLPSMKEGDDIYIKYDGIDYNFEVEEIFEIYPSDIQILEQNPTDAFITLVTCVPPGDPRNPKRLIVRARVVS